MVSLEPAAKMLKLCRLPKVSDRNVQLLTGGEFERHEFQRLQDSVARRVCQTLKLTLIDGTMSGITIANPLLLMQYFAEECRSALMLISFKEECVYQQIETNNVSAF
jgi:ABC-type hemin transport system ATPase subunit